MDRKHCVLFYSENSQASVQLLDYISKLPIDFPTLTGLSIVSVDNNQIKQILLQHNIEAVPVLLIEYFVNPIEGGLPKKQKLYSNQIYQWIDEMTNKCIEELNKWVNLHTTPPTASVNEFVEPVTFQSESNDVNPDPSEGYKRASKPKDIASIAAEMAKQRDLEDSKYSKKKE